MEVRLEADPDRGGPGIIEGVLIRYGERARDRQEVFEPGSLRWDEGGIILNEQHNRQAPIMRFKPIAEGNELRIKASLPDTQRGRDAATSIRNGTLRGLSVEFVAEQERWRGQLRTIRKGLLRGAGLVDDGSYRTEVQVRAKQPRRYYL